jgi:hypothetical protein
MLQKLEPLGQIRGVAAVAAVTLPLAADEVRSSVGRG